MTKKRLFGLNILLFFVVSLFAAYNKTTYYANADGKQAAALKTAMYGIISNGVSYLDYSDLWTAYATTDVRPDGYIWDRYCNTNMTYGTNQDDGTLGSSEGQRYNREHSWPKSWFGGSTSKGVGTDLNHVVAADKYANNTRGSEIYGEVKSVTKTFSNSRFGTGGYGSHTSYDVFEPADTLKGDFARIYFYMVTMYQGNLSSWYSSYGSSTNLGRVIDGSTYPAFQSWYKEMLLAWAAADPVSAMEVSRNNAVYNKQNNRNPFIDFPGLEQYIWGTASSTNLSVANYVDPYDGSGTGGTGGGESGSGSYYYEKVASASDLTDGQYLIVCESANVAFNGGLETLDAASNTIGVTISNSKITATSTTEAAEFTIAAKTGGGYSIKSASGVYIGHTGSSNALKTSSSDDYTNTITISDGNATVTCNSKLLRYNATSGQTRFRYFGSEQTAIQLYKKVEGTSGNDPVVTTASFTTASKTLQVGGTFTQMVTTNSDGAVTYSSDDTSVATVDSSTGLVTAIAEGSTTITADIAATSNYTQGSASYTVVVEAVGANDTDELTATMLELTGNYGGVSGKTGASGTVYAAYGMKNGNNAIQIRSNDSSSGVVSTSTIGTISKVTVDWGTGTADGRTLNVYGSNSAYTTPSVLFNANTQGTLIGTIVCGTSTELSVSDSYKYIGLRSNSGAMYINSINIEWTPSGSAVEPENPTIYFSDGDKTLVKGEVYTQTVTTTSNGEVTYTSKNTQVATVDATTGEVTAVAVGTAIIEANVAATSSYNAATASYTVTVVEPTYYELITNASKLKAGDQILIAYVNGESAKAMSTTQASNNRPVVDVILNADETLTPISEAQIITIEFDNDSILFNVGNSRYLYAASATSNWLRTTTTANSNAKAFISIADSVATIVFQGENTNSTIRYNPNNGSPIFSCYASTSTIGSLPRIYRLISEEPEPLAGDVDGDGMVGTGDVETLVNMLLGRTPENSAADVDGVDGVTIADITKLVNIILNHIE